MRILFVTHNAPRMPGDAAGSFVLRLAVALAAIGVRVEIIAPGAPGHCGHDVIEGVPINRVRYGSDARMTLAYTGTMVEQVRASWSARWHLLRLMWALRRTATRTVRVAQREGDPIHVVHVHWWFPAGLALWRAWSGHAPATVVTMHGSDVRLPLRSAPARALMRRILPRFAQRTTVSSWLAEQLRGLMPSSSVGVAPMPVDDRYFHRPAREARAGVLFVGRLNAQKGLADLLAAMASPVLAAISLDVVGDGPDRDQLQVAAARLGIADRIRWHGVVPQHELAPLYQAARVVAMPSREEGLGLVGVEAQLCGTPVVGYASGGLSDVVATTEGGALVPAGDIAALAHALHATMAQSADEGTRAEALSQAMRDRFGPEAVAQRYRAIYAAATARSVM